MMVLVSYDVSTTDNAGRRRLRNVEKICQDYGQRVHNSVFECLIDPAQWTAMQNRLLNIINLSEDSLRFYYLGKSWERKVEHHGTKKTLNLESDALIL